MPCHPQKIPPCLAARQFARFHDHLGFFEWAQAGALPRCPREIFLSDPSGVCIGYKKWVVPPPRMPVTTRITTFLGLGIPINLHLPQLLGGGTTQVIQISWLFNLPPPNVPPSGNKGLIGFIAGLAGRKKKGKRMGFHKP